MTVPVGPAPTLTFWLLCFTDEGDEDAFDTLDLSVTSGGVRQDLRSWSNLDATGSYVKQTFDLSPYAGQTVTLRFEGQEDDSFATSFLVDDLHVTGT